MLRFVVMLRVSVAKFRRRAARKGVMAHAKSHSFSMLLRLRGPRLGSRPSARKRDAHGGNARDAELAIDTVKLPSSPAQRGHAQDLTAKHNKKRDLAEMARARSPNKVESAVRLQRRRGARAQNSKVARFTARARGQPRRGAARRRSCLYFTFSDSFAKPQAR